MNRAATSGMKLMVINLARAERRLAAVKAMFAEAGLEFTRVDAVDASRLSAAELAAACPPVRFYVANARRAAGRDRLRPISHEVLARGVRRRRTARRRV